MSSKKRIGFLAVVTSLIIVIGYLIANQSQSKSPQTVVSPIGSPTTSPEPKLRSISIVSSGDILLHERLWAQAKADGVDGNWDFYPQLADLEPEISSAELDHQILRESWHPLQLRRILRQRALRFR